MFVNIVPLKTRGVEHQCNNTQLPPPFRVLQSPGTLVPLALRALHSEDLEISGKVEVRATLMSSERENAMLENIVQRLSLEPGITAVSWEVAEQEVV
jgi:uncharacterized membrane protein YhiD involved in acid resistance